MWPKIKPHLTAGKALYFCHGFSIVYKRPDRRDPAGGHRRDPRAPRRVRAPRCAGSSSKAAASTAASPSTRTRPARREGALPRARRRHRLRLPVRDHLPEGSVQRPDRRTRRADGRRSTACGSPSTKCCGTNGHCPSEAFNETVEEATQSLYPLIAEKGMDWMYANCSTTAQRGALDWFKPFRDASKPVFEKLYQSVASGDETPRTLEANSQPDYRQNAGEGTDVDRRKRDVEGRGVGALAPAGKSEVSDIGVSPASCGRGRWHPFQHSQLLLRQIDINVI